VVFAWHIYETKTDVQDVVYLTRKNLLLSLNAELKIVELSKEVKKNFCFKCEKYPCDKLKHLDKRYRTKYVMSMIENLENIKKNGIKRIY
jgi:hypothetical protein